MITDIFHPEDDMRATQIQDIRIDLQAIKDNRCQKCGTQAKGFIYRKKLPVYYCRRCLYREFGVERSISKFQLSF
ncbi:TPA: hypothetical protein EYP66_25000 [Candidatus Poribacteria bacterium]|nr:hypothetical protein [Candidatus Poribacteria bacterium]